MQIYKKNKKKNNHFYNCDNLILLALVFVNPIFSKIKFQTKGLFLK